jgi:hypothetical protein
VPLSGGISADIIGQYYDADKGEGPFSYVDSLRRCLVLVLLLPETNTERAQREVNELRTEYRRTHSFWEVVGWPLTVHSGEFQLAQEDHGHRNRTFNFAISIDIKVDDGFRPLYVELLVRQSTNNLFTASAIRSILGSLLHFIYSTHSGGFAGLGLCSRSVFICARSGDNDPSVKILLQPNKWQHQRSATTSRQAAEHCECGFVYMSSVCMCWRRLMWRCKLLQVRN